MNADAKGEREPEVLILDGGADSLHLRLGHVEPLLGVLLRRQEGDQVQRSQSCLSPETKFLDLSLLLHGIQSLSLADFNETYSTLILKIHTKNPRNKKTRVYS